VKLLFLASPLINQLSQHVLKGSLREAVLFYPVWQKTAPNSSRSRSRSLPKRAFVPGVKLAPSCGAKHGANVAGNNITIQDFITG
jgi:hypothetical protein